MEKLFTTAEAAAARLGVSKPGAEYLVLSALQLPEESARRCFERIGADPDDFAAALISRHNDNLRAAGSDPIDVGVDQPIPESVPSRRPVQYDASGRALFQQVVGLVREEKSQIYGASIVLVAAQIDNGNTPRTLQRMNVDRHELAAAARLELDTLNDLQS